MSDDYHPSPQPTPVDVVGGNEDKPHVPWYKDEKLRLWGEHGPSSASIIRVLIIAVVVALCVQGWVTYRGYTNGTSASDAAQSAKDATASLKHEISVRHKQRLKLDEQLAKRLHQLNAAIKANKSGTRDLACTTVIFFGQQSPQAAKSPFIQLLTHRYNCQGYVPVTPTFTQPGGGPGRPSATPGVTPGSPGPPGPTPSSPEPTATVTHTHTAPAPPPKTKTKTVSPPAPTHTPIVCIPSLGVCVG